jgi:hypothetical protein
MSLDSQKIDFSSLLLTINKFKILLIISVILSFTFSILYLIDRTLTYKSKATIELGSYITSQYEMHEIDSPRRLNTILNITFIGKLNSIKKITEIDQFIEIESISKSVEESEKNITEVYKFVSDLHLAKIDKIKSNYLERLKRIEGNIQTIQDKQIELLTQHKENIDYNALLNSLQLITILNGELEKKNGLKSLLKPNNFKNSKIVGSIQHNKNPENMRSSLIISIFIFFGIVLSLALAILIELAQPLLKRIEN